MSDVSEVLLAAQEARTRANQQYRDALVYAIEADWAYTRIARTLKISEAAVRNYTKRHGIK